MLGSQPKKEYGEASPVVGVLAAGHLKAPGKIDISALGQVGVTGNVVNGMVLLEKIQPVIPSGKCVIPGSELLI